MTAQTRKMIAPLSHGLLHAQAQADIGIVDFPRRRLSFPCRLQRPQIRRDDADNPARRMTKVNVQSGASARVP